MGSAVSHIICNLYVENFEQTALAKAENIHGTEEGPGTEIHGLSKDGGQGHQMDYRRRGGEGY